MTSTEEQIRGLLITAVQALTPSVLAETRFRVHREAEAFEDWCTRNGTAALRRLSIRDTGENVFPIVTDTVVEERVVIFEIQVAYPDNSRYGADEGRDRDDVMRSDFYQIEGVIGLRGYATYAGSATWLQEQSSPAYTRVTDGLAFQVFRNAYLFNRSMS